MNGEYLILSIGAKVLIGHSGCQLQLLQRSEGMVVRKTSSDSLYNTRLEAQCQKQVKFSSPLFHTPRVLDTGYKDGLFFFEMDYIQGIQLSEYIQRIPISECGEIIKPLLSLIPSSSPHNSDASSIFKQKIVSLERALPKEAPVLESLTRLQGVDWGGVPESVCHGDLTFENILVYKNKLYLIDFLDSFYNSWMLDIAKIFQDIEMRWSYRRSQVNENTHIRLLIIRDLFIQELEKRPNIDLDLLRKLVLLSLLRIIPYIKTRSDRDFIYMALERMI